MPRLPQLAQPLQKGPVRLRDAAESDIPEILIAYEDDPMLHIRLGQERPPSGAQLGRLAESEHADRAAGCRATLSIMGGDRDLCVGQVSVHHLDWDHLRAELSIWVAPGARGRGLGAGALRVAGAWLLRDCALARVQLVSHLDNEPMLRSAARAGFSREGVLYGYMRSRAGRLDVVMFSLLAADLAGA